MRLFILCLGLSVGVAIGYIIHPETPESHNITVYEGVRGGPVSYLVARPCPDIDGDGLDDYYLDPRTCKTCCEAHAKGH